METCLNVRYAAIRNPQQHRLTPYLQEESRRAG
jgi:hypothetical protein